MRTWWPLLLLCTLLAGTAAAEDDAKTHNDRATAAFALGRYGEAATEWEAAFGMKPQPALLYNAAQAHRLASNKARALMLYQNYLRLYSNKVTNRVEVERHIATLEQAIERDKQVALAPPVGPSTTMVPIVPETPPPPPVVVVPAKEPARALPLVAKEPEAAPRKRSLLVPVMVTVASVVVVGAVVGVGVGVGMGSVAMSPVPSLGAVSFGSN